jgi:hypothetical protein
VPERAAHAALAAVTAARDDEPPVGVQASLHVATVPVAVDAGGTRIDADVLRRLMTDVDALVAEAGPNTVVVTESVRALLGRKFVLVAGPRSAGRQTLRLVHRPRAALDHRSRLTTFVGRQRELDALDGELAVAASGRGRVVGIVGDAGMGKSRLVWEFRERVAGEGVVCVAGHCVPQGGAIPYLPVLDLLREHAHLSEGDPLGMIVERLSRTLTQAGLDPVPRLPFLLRLLGIRDHGGGLDGLNPEVVRARTFGTMLELFLGASGGRALVVLVEDLHWIDRTSDEWLGALVERLSGSPLLLVVTYRPGYQPGWSDRSYATQLSLAPLGREDSFRVVAGILGDAAGALTEPVLVRAEGNPFFLEELAIAVRDHACLEGEPTIPATIDEVVGGRIDRLAPEPRRLLGAAAVLGRAFSHELLAAVWRDSLDPHVDTLIRQEFLLPRAAAAKRGYVFKHPLTQELAYTRLEPGERRRLHALAGEALEAQAGRDAEVVDRLAYHWARTDDAARAVTWLVRFADRAARGSSHEEAVGALESAREHTGRLPVAERDARRLDVVMRLARSLSFLGRIGEALTRVAGEGPGVSRLDDRRLTGRFAFLLGNLHCLRGNLGEAKSWAARAVGDAEAAGDVVTLGRACQVMAYECWWSGRPGEGLAWGHRSVACLERAPRGRVGLRAQHFDGERRSVRQIGRHSRSTVRAHCHARRPVPRQAWQGLADDAESRLAKEPLGSEEGVVVLDAFTPGARVGLDGRRAVRGGVGDGGTDERHRDAPAALPAAHGDAGDDPHRRVVDARGGPGGVDAGEFGTRCDRDPADHLPPAVREQTGRGAAAGQRGHRPAAPLRGVAAGGQGAFHLPREPRVHAPAAAPPPAALDAGQVIHPGRGEGADREIARALRSLHVRCLSARWLPREL